MQKAAPAAGSLPLEAPLAGVAGLARASARPWLGLWAGSWGLALLAHAAVLLMLARAPADLMAGGAGHTLDAISITLVSSGVLEALEVDKVEPDARAAVAAVEATSGVPEATPAAGAAPRETPKQERVESEQPRLETPKVADAVVAMPPSAEPERAPEARAAAAGGADVHGDAVLAAPVRAQAAASAGALREYARYVSQALARTRPKGAGGERGTVRIKFAIGAGGGLAVAEVASSSGRQDLDHRALEAVRRAAFPPPPPGLSLAQLTYVVPYHFR